MASDNDNSTNEVSSSEGSGSEDSQASSTADLPNSSAEGDFLARYFPLDAQMRWEYQVEIHRPGNEPQTSAATKSIGGTTTVDGEEYVRVVTKAAMPVPDQLYRAADDGIYAAVQGSPGNELLIFPADPTKRTSWTGSALPVIKNLTGKAVINESYESTNEKFGDCVKVTLTMTIVEKSFFGGAKEVPVRFDRWFASGLGMVAEVRAVGVEGEPGYMKTISQLIR